MTQKRATPTIKRRRVGGQLKRWMGTAKAGDVAKRMDWDGTRLSRILRGTYRISGEEVRRMAEVVGVDDPEGVAEVARVAEQPIGSGWWAAYDQYMPENLRDFIELEAEALELQVQHSVIIPGLLQSPGYVREMITHAPARVSPDEVEALISIRQARQSVLGRVRRLHALVPESALHARLTTGPAMMRDQIRKLLDASEMPNVELQLVPLTAHPTCGANGAVTLMSFQSPWVDVASVDSPMGGNHTEETQEVEYLQREFTAIADIALPADKSRDVLNSYLEGLHK